ncbi:hypothetical protein [Absidia glauca]|uniref:Gti1/Pac2 family protein n=1 Tax=Absidia glauca TaxID=4829 RepID=A0A168T2V4_ABSGL|nr:hypothetical protein [Absidia glauca]
MPVIETFFGYVETTKDSLILLEACRKGHLPRVGRRLQEQERHLVKSGAVFCFDENESGIKRWTDGLVWSPSRIHGNFLVYRELDDRKNDDEQQQQEQQQDDSSNNVQLITSGLTLLSKRQRERSSRHSYRFKDNGLIKKSMSVVVNGVQQHLISYYNKDDVFKNKFQTPSDIPELAALEISAELLDGQNFRIPFLLGGDDPNRTTTGVGDKKGATTSIERPAKQKKRSASSTRAPRRPSSKAICPTTDPIAEESPCYLPPLLAAAHTIPVPVPFDNQYQLSLPHLNSNNNTIYFSDYRHGSGTSSSSSSSSPSSQEQHHASSYSLGSDAHHHQWTPHSFSTGYSIDRFDQNPHQHLFSSTSFHAINHAAIPTRTPELVSNAFMLDINALFGSGWNDFEIQISSTHFKSRQFFPSSSLLNTLMAQPSLKIKLRLSSPLDSKVSTPASSSSASSAPSSPKQPRSDSSTATITTTTEHPPKRSRVRSRKPVTTQSSLSNQPTENDISTAGNLGDDQGTINRSQAPKPSPRIRAIFAHKDTPVRRWHTRPMTFYTLGGGQVQLPNGCWKSGRLPITDTESFSLTQPFSFR